MYANICKHSAKSIFVVCGYMVGQSYYAGQPIRGLVPRGHWFSFSQQSMLPVFCRTLDLSPSRLACLLLLSLFYETVPPG